MQYYLRYMHWYMEHLVDIDQNAFARARLMVILNPVEKIQMA